MAARAQKNKTATTKPAETVEEPAKPSMSMSTVSKEETDALLDEIDDLLVENAEEFVASYVQRGGE